MTKKLNSEEKAKIQTYASAGTRLGWSIIFGLAVALALGATGRWKYVPLGAWDGATLLYVGWIWHTVRHMDAAHTRELAVREDPGRTATEIILVVASLVSLVAVGFLISQASNTSGSAKVVLVGFGVLSVVLTWALVHTVYMLKYARLYYGEPEGGINFNQTARPCYADFAYVAFTLGMTYQVSDTALQTKEMRSTVLKHTLLSYLFGTVIIACTINFLAGLSK